MDKLELLCRSAKAVGHCDPVEPATLPVEPDRSKYAEDEAGELGYAKDMRDYIDTLRELALSHTTLLATKPVAKYGGRRKSPDGTNECWAFLLCKPEFDPPEGTKLYALEAPQSGQEQKK